MKSGIYFIRKIGGKIYIGSSKDVFQRLKQHFSKLGKNKHANQRLQNTYNKYGVNVFKTGILEFCKIECLIEREQFYIDGYDKEELFNLRLIVESNRGIKMPPSFSEKLSERMKGNQVALGYKHNSEAINNMKKGNKQRGIARTDEEKQNLSNKLKGRVFSPDTINRMSIAQKNRPAVSPETIAKREATRIANKLKKLELAA